MNEVIKWKAPALATQSFPDSDRYKGGFGVRSSSSDKIYKISFDTAPGALYWKCSCVGGIRWGQCKHLTACGLKGRPFGRQIGEAKKYGWLG